MFKEIKRILVLAPHTDDGEFGCGASIAKFVDQGIDVFYVAFSTAEESLPKGLPPNTLEIEVKAATKVLGVKPENLIIFNHQVRKLNYVRQEILESLVKMKKEINPDLVFIPSINDLHQDHHTVATEGLRAFKQKRILAYELPWNNITFKTQSFITVEKEYVVRKIDALKCYKSQLHRPYATENFLWSWATMRGTQIGVPYAESFEVIRWIIE